MLAAAIVLMPGAPLGLLTTAVQALAGVLLPSASVFLLLLCNDPEVLGPWTNDRWLNVIAGLIIGCLLMLSGTLVVTTLFTWPQRGGGGRGLAAREPVAGLLLAFGWLQAGRCAGAARRARRRSRHADFARDVAGRTDRTGGCRRWPCLSR